MSEISFTSVSCNRSGKFDAEVQLRWGPFDNPCYKQVLISTGHSTSKDAKAAAAVVATTLLNNTVSHAISMMAKYKDAKP